MSDRETQPDLFAALEPAAPAPTTPATPSDLSDSSDRSDPSDAAPPPPAEVPAPTVAAPLVSIVVPAHNCRELTEACIASILRHTRVPFEVLLVDDASDAESAAAFRRLATGPVRLLRNETRRSFSANNNLAAAAARGACLCLLNNDTLVTPGWLEAMVSVLAREPDIGVLGNKHLFPDKPGLHHAGMAFDATGNPLHLHPHTDPSAPAVNVERDVPCVTFACVLIPADFYRQLGGLDEAYRNGYEDCDFCLRALRAGRRVVYTPASAIFHYGQQSPNRTAFDGENARLFRSRWPDLDRGSLERIQEADRQYNHRRESRPRRRPAAPEGLHLAVDFSSGTAFSWAAVEWIQALLAQGVSLSVPWCSKISTSIPRDRRRMLRSLMREPACRTWHVKWSHYWPAHLKQDLCGEVNAEFFCTNYRGGPGRRGLDRWLRNVQVNGYRKLPVSRFNLEALADIGVPASDCEIVPLGYSPEIDALFPEPPPRPERRDRHLLLVTNSHDLHRYGTDIAVKALGAAYGKDDSVVLHVKDYGAASGGPRLREWIAAQPRFPRVQWHDEFLSKEDLIRLYAQMDALLAPYRGEGFSMKILDAMALGLPVLMPSFGGPVEFAEAGTFIDIPWTRVPVAGGYDRENWFLGDDAWWCEPDATVLTELLRRLLSDAGAASAAQIGRAAARRVRGRFTWAASAEKLLAALQWWSAGRMVHVGPLRRPDEHPLSVVIPTKDRPDSLGRTLRAYTEQTLPATDYELILVNDHGDRAALDAVAAPFAGRLPLKVMENPGPGGPAAARNEGLARARGEVVLITGDDIVPDRGFLLAHLEGHRRFPALEQGLIGLTKWHPDLKLTPFLEYITGEGGQQFNYRDMKEGRRAPYDRFYTSNGSLKRAFLLEEDGPFSTAYRFAAYEDVELAWRLHRRGLDLRFASGAVGYHDHPMSPESFLRRQFRTGQMLALLAVQRPALVPDEHTAFLRAMDFAMRQFDADRRPPPPSDAGTLMEELRALCDWLFALGDASDRRAASDTDLQRSEAGHWAPYLHDGARRVWEAVNELTLRMGMAEEWAANDEDRALLRAWLEAVSLPRLMDPDGLFWRMPWVSGRVYGKVLFPRSKTAFLVSQILRSTPGVKQIFTRLESSPAGQKARDWLVKVLKKKH